MTTPNTITATKTAKVVRGLSDAMRTAVKDAELKDSVRRIHAGTHGRTLDALIHRGIISEDREHAFPRYLLTELGLAVRAWLTGNDQAIAELKADVTPQEDAETAALRQLYRAHVHGSYAFDAAVPELDANVCQALRDAGLLIFRTDRFTLTFEGKRQGFALWALDRNKYPNNPVAYFADQTDDARYHTLMNGTDHALCYDTNVALPTGAYLRTDTKLVDKLPDAGHCCTACVDAYTLYYVAPRGPQNTATPKVHKFGTTGEAYDASQSSDDIVDGDVLWVPSAGVAAVLVAAWPIAVDVPADLAGAFHTLVPGAEWHDLEHGDYTVSVELARKTVDDVSFLRSVHSVHAALAHFRNVATYLCGGNTGHSTACDRDTCRPLNTVEQTVLNWWVHSKPIPPITQAGASEETLRDELRIVRDRLQNNVKYTFSQNTLAAVAMRCVVLEHELAGYETVRTDLLQARIDPQRTLEDVARDYPGSITFTVHEGYDFVRGGVSRVDAAGNITNSLDSAMQQVGAELNGFELASDEETQDAELLGLTVAQLRKARADESQHDVVCGHCNDTFTGMGALLDHQLTAGGRDLLSMSTAKTTAKIARTGANLADWGTQHTDVHGILGSIAEKIIALAVCSPADVAPVVALLRNADTQLEWASDAITVAQNAATPDTNMREFSNLTMGQALGMCCVYCKATANANNPTVQVGRSVSGGAVYACATHPNGLHGAPHSTYRLRHAVVDAARVTIETFDEIVRWVERSNTGYIPFISAGAADHREFAVTSFVTEGDEPSEQSAQIGDYVVLYPLGRWRVYNAEDFTAMFEQEK